MATGAVTLERVLPAHASSAATARALVRDALAQADLARWKDDALLAVSEIVTNALVHAGTSVHLQIRVTATGLRVEVADGSAHLPAHRDYSSTSGTGRGLHLLDDVVDRWGTFAHGEGKVVWFEMQTADVSASDETPFDRAPGRQPADRGTVDVVLLNVPLLMHAAWQEHASSVLRELLLIRMDEGDPGILEEHAAASDAMNLLFEQVPAPVLGDEPEALMATALEPVVSRDRIVLRVPHPSVPNFETLDELLDQAMGLAEAMSLLVPPTQPEIRDMRAWFCAQVRDQSTGTGAPDPYMSRPDLETSTPTEAPDWDPAAVSESPDALIATNEASVIVAVSQSALAFLGYREESDLVGRRIISIVPLRYHQAHIAGTTLHMTNGRGPLLNRRIRVPVVRADATEQPVDLVVESNLLPAGRRIFVATFFLEDHVTDLVE